MGGGQIYPGAPQQVKVAVSGQAGTKMVEGGGLRYDQWKMTAETTKNGEKKDMEPEKNGSKDESRWEQFNMSEGAADLHGMGAISNAKPEGANAQQQTENGTAEPPP